MVEGNPITKNPNPNPKHKQKPPTPPTALLLRLFLLASLLWFTLPWLYTLSTLSAADCDHLTPASVRPDLLSIQSRLAAGGDLSMHRLFPEGRLFSHSFYGFTLINLAISNPADAPFRQHTLAELARLIPLTESLARQPPFDKSLTPPGGIIPAGHANLLRAGYALLGGTDPSTLSAFHAQSLLLFTAFSQSPVANLESYANQIWPVDNLCALESLRLHDVLYHTTYSAAATRWAAWMSAHLDPATGLLNMQIDRSGLILDGPRGCGLSWTFAFLPNLAPDLARSQYALYRTSFFQHPLGTTGIREFPPGRTSTFIDSDTGPIFFGLGTAATGFGIAAAKANHDPDNLTGLLRALQLTSFPTYSATPFPPQLTRSHFFGQLLLADEIALWGQTLTPWSPSMEREFPDSPPGQSPATPTSQSAATPSNPSPLLGTYTFRYVTTTRNPPPLTAPLHNFFLIPTILALLTLLLTLLLLRSIRGIWQNRHLWPRPLPRPQALLLALSLLTLPALLLPNFSWLYAFLLLSLSEILTTRLFPLNPAAEARG